jgi:hypothetical protein
MTIAHIRSRGRTIRKVYGYWIVIWMIDDLSYFKSKIAAAEGAQLL